MLCLQQPVLWLGTHSHRTGFYSTHQRLRPVPSICYPKIKLGYFLRKSQTGQRHSKDLAKTQAQRKISLSLVLFISVTAALEATSIEILDAFVSPQSHALLTWFLDQTAFFFYGPKILRGDPLCYLYLITNIRED